MSKAGAQAVLDATDAKVTAAELAVVDAQAGCSGLAGRLAGRLDPARADDDALGASVLGGFRDPIAGREALAQTAAAKLTLAEDQDRAARAGERVAAIKAEHGVTTSQFGALRIIGHGDDCHTAGQRREPPGIRQAPVQRARPTWSIDPAPDRSGPAGRLQP